MWEEAIFTYFEVLSKYYLSKRIQNNKKSSLLVRVSLLNSEINQNK